MKKKLNVDSITNELEGASLFFTKSASPLSVPEPEKVESTLPDSLISAETEAPKEMPEKVTKSNKIKTAKSDNDETVIPRHHDTMTPRYHDINHGVVVRFTP